MERPSRDAFAARFDAYVSELREVFASRGLRFGRPKDVTAIAQALRAPGGVQDDATAMIRSILYREHEGLSRAELASVIVVAAGGADLYASAQEGDAVQQLDAFVNGVRLAMRAKAPVESEEADEVEAVATPEEIRAASASAAEIPLRREEVYAEEDVDEVVQPVAARAERASVLAGVYSQAQRMSEIEREGGAGGEGTYFLKAKAEPEVDEVAKDGTGATLEDRAAGAYWGWVVGLCVLGILLAAGLVWRHRAAAREDVARADRPSGAASVAGEPTSKTGNAVQNAVMPGGAASGRVAVGSVAGVRGGGSLVAGAAAGSASEKQGAAITGAAPVSGDHVGASATTDTAPTSASAVGASSTPPSSEKPSEPTVAPAPKPKHEAAPMIGQAAVSPAVAGKYVVSSGVMSGNLISAPEPAYPKMAKMWGIEGQVIMQAVISSKGKVVAAHVLDGHKMLRGSAMNAVRKWRYKPYVVDGRATDVATVVIVQYKLKP